MSSLLATKAHGPHILEREREREIDRERERERERGSERNCSDKVRNDRGKNECASNRDEEKGSEIECDGW